jgi:ribosome recycling factor
MSTPPPTLDAVLAESRRRFDTTLEHAARELAAVRAGRASTASLENIPIELYGSRLPLLQAATLGAPEARLLTVTPFDPSAIGAIERALRLADASFNPQNDGRTIRINVPPLTEERRKELVKTVKANVEKHKGSIRDLRNKGSKQLKEATRGGGVGEDELRRAEQKLKEASDERVKRLQDLLAAKEADLLAP